MFMALLLTLFLTSLLAASDLPTLIERFERGTWGYQTLTVDLGSNINGADTDNSYPKLHVTSPDSVSSTPGGNSHSSNFALNGDFRYSVVWESEDVCYSLTARPSFAWSKGKHELLFRTSEETNKWINTSDDEVEKNSASIDFTLLTVSPEVAYLIQLTNRMGCTLQAGVSYYDFSGDVDYSYLQGEISADLAYYLSPSTQLVFYTDYHRFDFFSDEAIDDGGKQSDNWRVELSIHWRPVSLLF